MRDPDANRRPLSDLVGEIARSDASSLTLGELIDLLGGRALGGLLLVFGLACVLPLPPGATTVFGMPLVLLAPQLLFDVSAPWCPQRLRARAVPAADLKRVFARMVPWLRRMEAVSRPRLGFVLNGAGRRLIGLICTLLALVLILPIPLGNMLPAATVSVFSLALIQRDGAVALAGYAFAAASLGLLVLAAQLVGAAARQAISTFALA